MNNFQLAFDHLVKNPDSALSGELLECLAMAVWYQKFVPDVSQYRDGLAAQAGFLLDKLTRYNCMSKEQKEVVREPLRTLKAQSVAVPSSNSLDSLANAWGVSYSFSNEFRSLLPLQTRHYKVQSLGQ